MFGPASVKQNLQRAKDKGGIICALCHPDPWRTKMSKSLLLMICLLTGILVLACSKAENTNKNTNTAAAVPAGSVSTNKNTNATAATAAAEKIGVEECDAYITAYENCVSSKVPEAQRAQYQNSLSQLRSSWKKLAENPATKGTLASACKTAHENAKVSMKSFNCTF